VEWTGLGSCPVLEFLVMVLKCLLLERHSSHLTLVLLCATQQHSRPARLTMRKGGRRKLFQFTSLILPVWLTLILQLAAACRETRPGQHVTHYVWVARINSLLLLFLFINGARQITASSCVCLLFLFTFSRLCWYEGEWGFIRGSFCRTDSNASQDMTFVFIYSSLFIITFCPHPHKF
jgi:hypothetical protein